MLAQRYQRSAGRGLSIALATVGLMAIAPALAPVNASAASGCRGGVVVTPINRTAYSNIQCGILGSSGTQVRYSWGASARDPRPGVNGVCVSARGYRNGRETWYAIGCGTGGSATVPWGNVAAPPKIYVGLTHGGGMNVSVTATGTR
jgi:hypothetical protein